MKLNFGLHSKLFVYSLNSIGSLESIFIACWYFDLVFLGQFFPLFLFFVKFSYLLPQFVSFLFFLLELFSLFFVISLMDISDVLVIIFVFFVFNLMIFLEVLFDFFVSQQKRLVDFFAILLVYLLQFPEKRILVLGSTDGEFDFVQIIFCHFLNIHRFVWIYR